MANWITRMHLVKIGCSVPECEGVIWTDATPRRHRGYTTWDISVEDASCGHLSEAEHDPELYDWVMDAMDMERWVR